MRIEKGSLRLFRLFGVTVFVHWSWLLVAVFQIWRMEGRGRGGSSAASLAFSIAEYLVLFLIVTVHEFGHALACKSVGGKSEQIVLWPLGGLAFVEPPPRPGALLWSIAAGPLVNVVLLPVTIIPAMLVGAFAAGGGSPLGAFLFDIAVINGVLLVFNMLPIYPLDGGQILQSLLWFVVGRANSLIIAGALGLAGAAVLAVLALAYGGLWLGLIVLFIGFQAMVGVRVGLMMRRLEQAPRHTNVACPACGQHPPAAALWSCPCGARFDTFATGHQCPACQRPFATTGCPLCRKASPVGQWYGTRGYPVITVTPAATATSGVPSESA